MTRIDDAVCVERERELNCWEEYIYKITEGSIHMYALNIICTLSTAGVSTSRIVLVLHFIGTERDRN